MNNEVDVDNLVTVRTFAELIEMSTTWVYKIEKLGEISFVVIDGIIFVDKVANKDFL